MKYVNVLFLLFMLILFAISPSTHPAGLGVNISLPERGGTFVDVVKENHRWLGPNTWSPLDAGDFDEQGWPIVDAMLLIDARPVAEWVGEIDDPENYRFDWGGTYACSFEGKASVQGASQVTIRNYNYDATSNLSTFEAELSSPTGDGYGFFAIAFRETQRTESDAKGTGITDFKMIRPGYDTDAEKIFTDHLIHALTTTHFAAIRFMPFTGANGAEPEYPDVIEWSERKLPTDASQVSIDAIGKREGAAWEYVVELANLTNTDPWINVPVSATIEYVTQLATMFKENLHPDLNIYVESSNEVWNTAPGFEQTQYSKAQAQALGIGERENHARRTIELAQIFESVYGNGSLNTTVRVILCSHAPMLKWWVQPMLDYIEKTYGEPNQYIYALACQTYYSGGADAGESVDKILADCRSSITNQMNEPSGNQAGRKQWIAKAAELGLVGGFCSYEGGPDHGGGSTTNIGSRINAERSPAMADVFKYNIDDAFWQLGGNLAMQFTLTSAYNRYGCWGLTDDISNLDRNHKFQAARELIEIASQVQSRKPVSDYELAANYPNPFNPQTTIEFALSDCQHVILEVYDITGKKVRTLVDQFYPSGRHTVMWDGNDQSSQPVASGVYLYHIRAGSAVQTRSMVMLK
ncbi:T9SS type A sorting domain-containing protein [candidate division KSB1 bacterium]|nr:T9SS type A sorting domain-containing protein [candidate division KSB1 bacterium]